MRISDWSSDVCSSDLGGVVRDDAIGIPSGRDGNQAVAAQDGQQHAEQLRFVHRCVVAEIDRALHAGVDDESGAGGAGDVRSEEHTSELQSLMRMSYAVFCLKKKRSRRSEEQKSELQSLIRKSYDICRSKET